MAAVVGVFAGLNGIKTGFLGTGAAIFGLMLKGAMSVTWVYYVLALILVGTVLAAIASIAFKNRAVKDLICGAQLVKYEAQAGTDEVVGGYKNKVCNDKLRAAQTKPTRKLVDKIKKNLKQKGKL